MDIPDIPCKYYTCKEAGLKNEAYQTCYDERTFNKGGTLVPCKQVKCKLSKSECEEQAKATSHSCQIDKISGCYYLGECKQCNKDVYDLKEPKSGSDWECDSCTGCDGTVYNCTPINKECSDINSNYSTSCSESQIAHKVEGVKDSEGNQCYTCESKPVGCTYEYRQATTEDSAGVSGNLDDGYKCVNGSECWKKLYYVKSIIAQTGTPKVMPIINKISNKSATCVDENNVTKYQTICEGTPKSLCNTSYYEFKPNGCVSDTYNNGFEVKGDEFGTCTKKEEKCFYEYARLTISDTAGTYTFNTNSGLYSKFQNHAGNTKSASYYELSTDSYQAYSKIDKTSKTCTKIDGTIAYEKICTGTAKVACKKTFTPTCFSEGYIVPRGPSVERSVEAMEFGTCECDTTKGYYDTSEACRNATKLGCTFVSNCYSSCESLGYYTTRVACEKDMSAVESCLTPGAAQGNSSCYVRSKTGWGLHYAHDAEEYNYRYYNCTLIDKNSSGSSPSLDVGWSAYVSKINAASYTTDINGVEQGMIESYKGDVRFNAGKYRICIASGSNGIMTPKSLYLTSGSGEQCKYTWNSSTWNIDSSASFCIGVPWVGTGVNCITANFEDGMEYYIGAGLEVKDTRYSCTSKRYSSN